MGKIKRRGGGRSMEYLSPLDIGAGPFLNFHVERGRESKVGEMGWVEGERRMGGIGFRNGSWQGWVQLCTFPFFTPSLIWHKWRQFPDSDWTTPFLRGPHSPKSIGHRKIYPPDLGHDQVFKWENGSGRVVF